jgi:PA-IL-like protein
MGDLARSRDLASLEDVMTSSARWILTAALVTCLPLTLLADTLYLRNGTRIQGDLVGVRGSTIEFEERGGFGGSRTIRVDRSEVARIEFDSNSGGGWGGGSGGNWEGGGRPGGMRERQVNVAATVDWTDTGVQVRAGQTIYVQASGQVRWGRDRRDGPEGENNSPFNQARPLPNRPGAALIGRIGGDVFFIGGGQGPIRVRNGGRLELGINDEYLQDNSGSFRVTVFY